MTVVPQQLAATMKVHIHVRAMKVCMEMAVYASANLVSMVKVSRALIKMSVHRQGIYVIRELLVPIFFGSYKCPCNRGYLEDGTK